jgi:hypothetical protein
MTKNSILVVISCILLTSCSSQLQIGKINMISNRNIDSSIPYENLSSYSNGSITDIKKSRHKTIEAAIDFTVKSVPGGEYLMNARIWLIDGAYYAVEGDVWGVKQEKNYLGYKIGDKVLWRKNGKYYECEISSLKNAEECIVKVLDTGKLFGVKYIYLSKKE